MQYTFLWLLEVIAVHVLYINCGATEIIVHAAGFSALSDSSYSQLEKDRLQIKVLEAVEVQCTEEGGGVKSEPHVGELLAIIQLHVDHCNLSRGILSLPRADSCYT